MKAHRAETRDAGSVHDSLQRISEMMKALGAVRRRGGGDPIAESLGMPGLNGCTKRLARLPPSASINPPNANACPSTAASSPLE